MTRLAPIVTATARAFEVSEADILGINRNAHIVAARHAAIAVAHDMGASAPQIRHYFKRDTSGLINAALRHASRMSCQHYRASIAEIMDSLAD